MGQLFYPYPRIEDMKRLSQWIGEMPGEEVSCNGEKDENSLYNTYERTDFLRFLREETGTFDLLINPLFLENPSQMVEIINKATEKQSGRRLRNIKFLEEKENGPYKDCWLQALITINNGFVLDTLKYDEDILIIEKIKTDVEIVDVYGDNMEQKRENIKEKTLNLTFTFSLVREGKKIKKTIHESISLSKLCLDNGYFESKHPDRVNCEKVKEEEITGFKDIVDKLEILDLKGNKSPLTENTRYVFLKKKNSNYSEQQVNLLDNIWRTYHDKGFGFLLLNVDDDTIKYYNHHCVPQTKTNKLLEILNMSLDKPTDIYIIDLVDCLIYNPITIARLDDFIKLEKATEYVRSKEENLKENKINSFKNIDNLELANKIRNAFLYPISILKKPDVFATVTDFIMYYLLRTKSFVIFFHVKSIVDKNTNINIYINPFDSLMRKENHIDQHEAFNFVSGNSGIGKLAERRSDRDFTRNQKEYYKHVIAMLFRKRIKEIIGTDENEDLCKDVSDLILGKKKDEWRLLTDDNINTIKKEINTPRDIDKHNTIESDFNRRIDISLNKFLESKNNPQKNLNLFSEAKSLKKMLLPESSQNLVDIDYFIIYYLIHEKPSQSTSINNKQAETLYNKYAYHKPNDIIEKINGAKSTGNTKKGHRDLIIKYCEIVLKDIDNATWKNDWPAIVLNDYIFNINVLINKLKDKKDNDLICKYLIYNEYLVSKHNDDNLAIRKLIQKEKWLEGFIENNMVSAYNINTHANEVNRADIIGKSPQAILKDYLDKSNDLLLKK